jgi:predicted nucleic acid-binding protein
LGRVPTIPVVATDTNVLINLVHINRMDLLGKLPPYSFVVPEQVTKEVKDPAQAAAVRTAIVTTLLDEVQLTRLPELQLYAQLVRTLGIGESACLTLAECRGWLIASDERKTFYREAVRRLGEGRILNTAGILIRAITLDMITLEEADDAKAILERNRFRMKFASFRDVIP